MTDHALGEQAFERFGDIEIAAIAQRAGEETGVEQVQHRMFHAADILVDRHPVIHGAAGEGGVLGKRAETLEIPGRFDEGVERIGLAACRLAAGGAVDMLPGRMPVERIARGVEVDVLRQGDR